MCRKSAAAHPIGNRRQSSLGVSRWGIPQGDRELRLMLAPFVTSCLALPLGRRAPPPQHAGSLWDRSSRCDGPLRHATLNGAPC